MRRRLPQNHRFWVVKSSAPRRRCGGPIIKGLDESTFWVPQKSPDGRPMDAKLYTYEVDLERHDVARRVRKESFRIKPWRFSEASSNGKLPVEVQAAFQAARPFLNSLRETRQTVTRAICRGDKDWRKYYSRLKAFQHNVLERWTGAKYLRSIVLRYYRFCMSEVKHCCAKLVTWLGKLPDQDELFSSMRDERKRTGRWSVLLKPPNLLSMT